MNSVPGGADLEYKNQYWIDLGINRERERIVALLDKLRDSEYAEVMTHDDIVAVIRGD